jgi:hypothetical protein
MDVAWPCSYFTSRSCDQNSFRTVPPGGCVSSTALGAGELSTAALTAQCRRIEHRFAITYPFSFYGKFEAKNRAAASRSCTASRPERSTAFPF